MIKEHVPVKVAILWYPPSTGYIPLNGHFGDMVIDQCIWGFPYLTNPEMDMFCFGCRNYFIQ